MELYRKMAFHHIAAIRLGLHNCPYKDWQYALVYCAAHGFLESKEEVVKAQEKYDAEMGGAPIDRRVIDLTEALPAPHKTLGPFGAGYLRQKQQSGEDLGAVVGDYFERYNASVDKSKGVPWELFCLRRWIEVAVQHGTELRERPGVPKTYNNWDLVKMGFPALVTQYCRAEGLNASVRSLADARPRTQDDADNDEEDDEEDDEFSCEDPDFDVNDPRNVQEGINLINMHDDEVGFDAGRDW